MCRFARRFFFLLICFADPAMAGGVALVLSEAAGPYGEFAKVLGQSLSASGRPLLTRLATDSVPDKGERPELIVTAGQEALRQTLSRGGSAPVLATLLSRHHYERLLGEFAPPAGKVTAIYLDQPPARMASFLRNLLPGQKRFAMLFGSESREYDAAYRQALQRAGRTLDSEACEECEADERLLTTLNALLGRADALLAVPDGGIYRRNSIKAILITAFRQQKPVIGYSAALANAGALAALYVTPAQVARQTADLILAGAVPLPAASGPSQFAIAINSNVAQALGIAVPDEATLRQSMLADRENR